MQPYRTILAVCVVFGLPLLGRAYEKLVAVDTSGGLITIEQGETLKTFRVKSFTEISVNGVRATIDQLRPNMSITLGLWDSQTASSIVAYGNAGQTAAVSAKAALAGGSTPASPAAPGATATAARSLAIRLLVDGAEVIKIGGGRLWIEHAAAKLPTNISINGINWDPTWTHRKTEFYNGFAPALAPFSSDKVSVLQTQGRGKTTVLEPPTSENQETLSFRIQDNHSGAAFYEIQVNW